MGASIEIMPGLSVPMAEVRFRTSRSSGPGGQNVNKVESRVELLFDAAVSPSLSEDQRIRLLTRLSSHIDQYGTLHVVSQASRSQWENKEESIRRFASLVRRALQPEKKRVRTTATRASKKKRVESKRIHALKKKNRRTSGFED